MILIINMEEMASFGLGEINFTLYGPSFAPASTVFIDESSLRVSPWDLDNSIRLHTGETPKGSDLLSQLPICRAHEIRDEQQHLTAQPSPPRISSINKQIE